MIASAHGTFQRETQCTTPLQTCGKEDAMRRSHISLLVGVGSLILVAVWPLGVASAQQPAPTYPLDDKLANEPAPWTIKGKWGARGNWGRWGEEDKRGIIGRYF